MCIRREASSVTDNIALGWAALIAPLTMYLILTRLTGVPPLEAAMRASKGEAYAAYQARVSVFLPRPPKRGTA